MIKGIIHKIQSAITKLKFVFSFLSEKLAWMLALCLLLFTMQALWEGVIVSAVAVLLSSFSGSAPDPAADASGAGYQQFLFFYKGLTIDQKVVLGFVLAATTLFLRSVLNLGVYIIRSRLEALYIYEARRRTFAKLLHNKMVFFDNNQKGVLIQMVNNEARSCYDVLRALLDLTISLLMMTVYLVVMFILTRSLTAIVCLMCLGLFFFIRIVSRQIKRFLGKVVDHLRMLTAITDEGFGCVKQVKLIGFYHLMCEEFDKVAWQVVFRKRKGLILSQVQQVVTSLVALLIFMTLVFVNWKWQILGAGMFLTYLYVIKTLTDRISTLSSEWNTLIAYLPEMERILQAFKECEAFKETSGSLKRDLLLSDRIVFDNVSLDYGKGAAVKDVSLEIRRGQKIAFVGESGSGKTSIINLLVRLYDPTRGRILIDGTPLPDLDLGFLRSRIGVVNQDTIIFNRTIEDNIRMANQNAGHEDVVFAAQQAHAHEFIQGLPSGYQSPVGDRGVKLSGGQRQRLNIAQAFIKKPEIFIFDEATSALDTKSEQIIQQVFDKLGNDKTVFMVAHRLSTIRKVDIICVMKKGEIVERGTWDELMAKNGAFAEMVRIQSINS